MGFFKNVITFFKNILKSNKETNTKEEIISKYDRLYSEIEVGSIIWAKRYRVGDNLNEFPKGHEKGPYLVIKKENNKLYCFYGTSVLPQHDCYLPIDNFEYVSLSKYTYFKFLDLVEIDEFSLINNLYKLKDKELNSLYRKLKCFNKKYYNSNNKIINITLPRQVGDIILYRGKTHVIADINGQNLTCVSGEYINNFTFNANFHNIINLNNSEDIAYVGVLNNNQLEVLLKKYREHIHNLKNLNNTQRGSIILKDNKYYYVYGINGEELLIFEIEEECKEGYEQLILNNKTFYTIYKELTINKKDNYKNIYLCFPNEIEIIKSQRKKFKNKKSNSRTNSNRKTTAKIEIDSIVRLNDFSKDMYYVQDEIGNVLVCKTLAEKNNPYSKKYYFDKESVILVKSKTRK